MVRYLLPALRALARRVSFITSSNALLSAEFAAHIAPEAAPGEIVPIMPAVDPAGTGPVRRAWRLWRGWRDAVSSVQPDHVVVPTADGALQIVGALGGPPTTFPPTEVGLYRGAFAYSPVSPLARLRAWLGLRAIARSRFERVHFVDQFAHEMAVRAMPSSADRFRFAPDPIPPALGLSRREARDRLGLPTEGRLLGSVGRQDRRKGVDHLLRAFAMAAHKPGDRLLLAGVQTPDIAATVASVRGRLAADRLLVINRPLADAEIETVIAALDVVSVVYPRHIGSASFVLRAASARRPVLGASFGWIGAMVSRYDLGWVVEPTDIGALAHAIERALNGAGDYIPTAQAIAWVASHTVRAYQQAWTALLKQRLGMSSAEGSDGL